jgi:predicted Zn-dependent protease
VRNCGKGEPNQSVYVGHASPPCLFRGVEVLMTTLRDQCAHLPADPYVNYAKAGDSSEQEVPSKLPDRSEAVETITDLADGLDLVGIWAAGPTYTGFANSLGQRNWHACNSFNFDWSCYQARDKAVKANFAGMDWDTEALRERMNRVRTDLDFIARPAKTIEPGHYRVYLAPAAVQEVLSMMAWGGFGLKSQRTGQSPLQRLQQGEASLHPSVSLAEHNARGLMPSFTPQGFAVSDRVALIEAGTHGDALVDSRSAQEFDVAVNAAGEWPSSLDMASGDLPNAGVLDALGTGLYINNLWYLNYSDRNEARITGMTRFACWWVEDGRIQAPVNVMRFDDSIYRMFGEQLLGLTQERELLLDTGTYGGRSTGSVQLPGALIDQLRFTL